MVTIEENHELLDIILGYKPDRFLPNYLEVNFVNTYGIDMSFTLTSPTGVKYYDITSYKLSAVGVWTYVAAAENYQTKRGTILVTKSEFGNYIVVELDLERESGDVLIKGNGKVFNTSTEDIDVIPNMRIKHYVGNGSDYVESGYRLILNGRYQYFDDFEKYYFNVYELSGYKLLNYYYRTYLADEQELDDIVLIPSSLYGTGTILLDPKDITTGGNAYGNLYVKLFSGWGYQDNITADTSGEEYDVSFSSDDRPLSVVRECGYYTVKIWGDYYKENYINIYILPDPYANQNKTVFLTPSLKADGLKAVLTWGVNPSDLDSHLKAYRNGNQMAHVYYSNKSYYGNDGKEHINLDVDDTSSYGPETTSIYYRDADFKYYFYIYCWSDHSYGIPTDASIAIYSDGRLLFTVTPPSEHTGSSNYLYWKVFSYDGNTQEIKIKNKIVGYEPDESNWEEE